MEHQHIANKITRRWSSSDKEVKNCILLRNAKYIRWYWSMTVEDQVGPKGERNVWSTIHHIHMHMHDERMLYAMICCHVLIKRFFAICVLYEVNSFEDRKAHERMLLLLWSKILTHSGQVMRGAYCSVEQSAEYNSFWLERGELRNISFNSRKTLTYILLKFQDDSFQVFHWIR